jgi:uncharacterized protein
MKQESAPTRLDLKTLAHSGSGISGSDVLSKYERLSEEARGLAADSPIEWSAVGEIRSAATGEDQVWLHVTAQVSMPLVCQRCMGPMEVALDVSPSFRFVATEEIALAQDEEAEEDVLVFSREFNLAALIEDELLMALPLIPRHEACPTPVKLSAADAAFEQASGEKTNPFSALAKLQGLKPGKLPSGKS